ncbi:unnamed protein product, partial [Rotaria magnacalcarata]
IERTVLLFTPTIELNHESTVLVDVREEVILVFDVVNDTFLIVAPVLVTGFVDVPEVDELVVVTLIVGPALVVVAVLIVGAPDVEELVVVTFVVVVGAVEEFAFDVVSETLVIVLDVAPVVEKMLVDVLVVVFVAIVVLDEV